VMSLVTVITGWALARRTPTGWWMMNVISVFRVLGSGVRIGLWGLMGLRAGPPGWAIGLSPLVWCVTSLAVLWYLNRSDVQRACRVATSGSFPNFFVLMAGGVALLLISAALRAL